MCFGVRILKSRTPVGTARGREGSSVEEFKTDATGGSFIECDVQRVKAQHTRKEDLGEQPGCHRGFRFYSSATSCQIYNSKVQDVGASCAFPLVRGAGGSPQQNTHMPSSVKTELLLHCRLNCILHPSTSHLHANPSFFCVKLLN